MTPFSGRSWCANASRLMSIGSRGGGACNGSTLRGWDTEHMRVDFQLASSSLPILSPIRVIPRLPAGDLWSRCLRISPHWQCIGNAVGRELDRSHFPVAKVAGCLSETGGHALAAITID